MRSIAFVGSMLVMCIALSGLAHAQTTKSRQIYRCHVDGVLTFSDRPCASDAEPYEVDSSALNTFEPPPVRPATIKPATQPKRAKKSAGSAVDLKKHKEKCERLVRGLKDLRAKQRSGYKASEASRLKDRETKLKSQLREARCG